MNRLNIALLMVIAVFLCVSWIAPPSKYVSRAGHLHMETHSKYLDVIADNYQIYCEIQPISGNVQIKGLVKSFEFKMGAIDRAFNSDRVNLGQLSKFTYIGKVTNLGSINFDQSGTYPIRVEGTLTVGSFARITPASGNVIINADGTMRAETSFNMRIEEESVETINRLMKEKLPSMIAVDADQLGVSRDIQLELKANFRPRR